MQRNRRKYPRRGLQYPARIVAPDGSWEHSCRVLDISDGGAKLAAEVPPDLPRDFILALSEHGRATRRCELVWADAGEIGVRFSRPAES